ncbi:zinc finger protein CONSTANS-LIKE 2-like [Actinidia eriantha]|uniref:zinc finger protein CONSTANS-LIKE 2-like n=1 Tax=Actinidia eriantha TaxID=165200 RepID=UPI002590EE89|nr:zinc finger protein CONSTANS-LIKE 2-like [Actinidia eriantha]
MLKESSSILAVGNNNWARACDTCRSAACAVYCRTDSVYLCAGCDARIHAANQVASSHERVWVCEACERAPAAFICKADTASLCTSCDSDIHSANPLARRHHRVPVLPIPGCLYGPSATNPGGSLADPTADHNDGFLTQEADQTIDEDNDQDEASSWLLLNPVKNTTNQNGNGFLFGGEVVDEYLHLEEYNSCQEQPFTEQYNHHHQQHGIIPQKSFGGDRVVPVQCGEIKGQLHQQQQHHYQLGMMDYENPKTGYGYPASMSHSVSVSSMDVSVVPDSTMSDVSISHPRHPKGTIELFSSPPIHMPTQLTPMDREARVLRYREKKKMRKFEKTIRYASRKAYAETRPRIKGRFAKRTELEGEVDLMFNTTLMAEGGYGIVPSF